jgi:hypothetical protein
MLLWQPYTVRIVFYLRAAIALLQVISAYLSLVAVKTTDPDWEAASIAFALMSMYLSGVDAVISILLAIRDLVHLFQDGPDIKVPALQIHRTSDNSSDEEEYSELLEIPLIDGSFAYRASNDTSAVVHVAEVYHHHHGMPPRQSSSSSSEEEDERRRKLRANRHEVLRDELTGLMNTSSNILQEASSAQLRDALASGDYFLNVGDTRTPTPSALRVKTISPAGRQHSDDDEDVPPHAGASLANYSFVAGNASQPHRTAGATASKYLTVPQSQPQHQRTISDNSSGRSSRSNNATNSSFGL